jgi:hypothetical protein
MSAPVTGVDPQPLTLADRVCRNPGALSAEIDDEVVALDIARGACYGLDAVGARIWAMIAAPKTVRDVCDALTEAYEVDGETCRADVMALLTTLRQEGLIEIARAPPNPPSISPKTA